jgi:PadR family transcriptional regulator AphA
MIAPIYAKSYIWVIILSLKHALLGFLSFGPATGYELKHAFENSIQHFWSADLSQIYRTLESLREEGLVTMRIEHQESKPPKHIYSLTESGRAELLRWLHEPTVELPTVRNPFLLKIFFGALLPKEALLGHLHRFDEALQQRIDVYKQIEEYLPRRCRELGLSAHEPFLLATVRLGVKSLEVYQQWCRDLISEVKQLSRS